MRPVAGTVPTLADGIGVAVARLPVRISAPTPDSFVRDVEHPLGEEFLNVAIAQREAQVDPDRALDDRRRKAVATRRLLQSAAHPLRHRLYHPTAGRGEIRVTRCPLFRGKVSQSQTSERGGVGGQLDGSGLQRQIRIDAVEHDPKDPGGEVVLYAFSERDPASGEWRNLCEPDPEGRRLGFPLAGAFSRNGAHVGMAGSFLITCTGGAEGKGVRFGYKPWRKAPDGNSLAAYYQACVRLVRDYCGDGVGYTRNGTPIDLFDRIGIQRDELVPGMTFEAAWDPMERSA